MRCFPVNVHRGQFLKRKQPITSLTGKDESDGFIHALAKRRGAGLMPTRQKGHRAKACHGWLRGRIAWKRAVGSLSRGKPAQGTLNSLFDALPLFEGTC